MKKSELIDKLNETEGDVKVMLSRDEEGNGFQTLHDVELSALDEDGEPCHPEDADGDKGQAIVLWP